MSNDKIIEIICKKNGEVTVQTKGFKGKGCAAVTKAFEDEFEVVETKKTSEWFEREEAKNEISIKR